MNLQILTLAALCLLIAGCAGGTPSGPAEPQPDEPVLEKRPKHRWRDVLGKEWAPPSVTCVSISPDGRRCLAPNAEMLMLRSLPSGELLREFEPTLASERTEFGDDIWCMAVDWKREIAVTGDGRGLLRVWNLATGKLARAIQASRVLASYGVGLESLALSDDGCLIYSSGRDSGKRAAVKVWELESGKLLRVVARSGGNAPDAPYVDPRVDGRLPKDYRPDLQPNTSYKHFLLLNGGKRALLSGDVGYLALWDLERDKAVWKLDAGGLLDATPDGRRSVEIPLPGHKLVVRGINGNELRTIQITAPHGPEALRVLPDGRRAVTGGVEGDLMLWDLDEGKAIERWVSSAHRDRIIAIAVSGEANIVLTGSPDEVLQLWDLNTGKIVRDLTPPRSKRPRLNAK
jgi:WD40 repeat protein